MWAHTGAVGARLAWLLVMLAASVAAPSVAEARVVPFSSHSQLHATFALGSPLAEQVVREAHESGAAYIRVDLSMDAMFRSDGSTHWWQLDLLPELSRRYSLPVVAVLVGTSGETDCTLPFGKKHICAPSDERKWAAQAAEVAARYRGTIDHIQIWNEPDGDWAFRGTPRDYARLLSASYDAIKARSPTTQVVLGPTMRYDAIGTGWLDAVFRAAGYNAAAKFDIASMHLRGPIGRIVKAMGERQAFLRAWGRTVPMWVTEHGYSADPAWQNDPAFRGGEQAQAAYLGRSMPALADAGADQVFVTLHDGGEDQYAAEGLMAVAKHVPGTQWPIELARKPAWYAVRDLTANWWRRPTGPARFRASFLQTTVRARALRLRRKRAPRQRATVTGKFRGVGCTGSVALRLRTPRTRTRDRTIRIRRDCRYRTTIEIPEPRRRRRADRLVVTQRFLGNPATTAGTGRTLRVKLGQRRKRR